VARSNVLAFTKMGARVTVCGPPTLIPRGFEALGCEVRHTLDGSDKADVLYALRMQRERMTESFVPSLREYAATYQIDGRGSAPARCSCIPGPSTAASSSPPRSSTPRRR
jgi:aspartate carbamoyltransferase catalytic subunit